MAEQRKTLDDGLEVFKIERQDIAEFEKAIEPYCNEIARVYKKMNLPPHWGQAFSFNIKHDGSFKRGLFMNMFVPVGE